jgi:hypothetical protein
MKTRFVVVTALVMSAMSSAGSASSPYVGSITVISGAVPGLPAGCTGVTVEGEPFVASEPDDLNHIVAEWSVGDPTGANTSVAAVSHDGGQTWDRSAIGGTGPCSGGPGDYVIDQWMSVGVDGRAYYESFAGHDLKPGESPIHMHTLVATSGDGGNTWPTASAIDDNLYGATGIISRTSITADPNVAGRAWAVWARLVNPALQGIYVSRSDNGGASWGTPVKAADVPGGAAAAWQIVVRPDGGLVLFYGAMDTEGTIRGGLLGESTPSVATAVLSEDHGATWTSPVTVAPLPEYVLARAAAAPDGSVYLAWAQAAGAHGTVLVARSADGGRTWAAPSTVDAFPAAVLGARYIAPDIAVSGSTIGVSYYDARAGGDRIARRFAYSDDNGATWSGQQLGEAFSFETGGGTGDGPQGAYQGLTATANGFGAVFIAGTGVPSNPTEVLFASLSVPAPA